MGGGPGRIGAAADEVPCGIVERGVEARQHHGAAGKLRDGREKARGRRHRAGRAGGDDGRVRGGEAARFRRDEPVAPLRRLDRAAFGEDRGPVLPRDLQELQRDLPILVEMIRHHGVEALPRHLARRHVVEQPGEIVGERERRRRVAHDERRLAGRRAPVPSPRLGRGAPGESAARGRRARAAGRARRRRRRRSPCRRTRARPRRCRRSARCAAAAPPRPRARRGRHRARAGRRGGSAGRWWSRRRPSGSEAESPSMSRPSPSAPRSAGRNGADGGTVKTRGFMVRFRAIRSLRVTRQIFERLSPMPVAGRRIVAPSIAH